MRRDKDLITWSPHQLEGVLTSPNGPSREWPGSLSSRLGTVLTTPNKTVLTSPNSEAVWNPVLLACSAKAMPTRAKHLLLLLVSVALGWLGTSVHVFWLTVCIFINGPEVLSRSADTSLYFGHKLSAACLPDGLLWLAFGGTLCHPSLVGGHLLSEDPPIYTFEGLVSATECSRAVDLAEGRMAQGSTNFGKNEHRWSKPVLLYHACDGGSSATGSAELR